MILDQPQAYPVVTTSTQFYPLSDNSDRDQHYIEQEKEICNCYGRIQVSLRTLTGWLGSGHTMLVKNGNSYTILHLCPSFKTIMLILDPTRDDSKRSHRFFF